VALFNLEDGPMERSFSLTAEERKGKATVLDIWQGTEVAADSDGRISCTLPAHACALYRILSP